MSLLDSLPAMEVAARAQRLRDGFDQAGCGAALISNMVNIRYLTGFTGSAGLLAVLPEELLLVTDGRYRDQAPLEAISVGVEVTVAVHTTPGAQREALATAMSGVKQIGLEANAITWATQRRYESDWFPEHELVATEGLVEAQRVIKDEGEVARIAAAGAIADAALASVKPFMVHGVTESEIALELDMAMRRGGASGSSFETIVASGPNGARPHARPGSRQLTEGDLIVIDFGAIVDGYCSDMTRTVVLGEPSPTAARMLEVVAAGQAAGVSAIGPGVSCADVDRAARDVIDAAGWGEAFLHGTGHGVGLDIHEEPRVSSLSTATLRIGHVVTVEPGVYLPEHGGVRIEDTLVVTSEGARSLTLASKDPALL
ncbi:MAG: M24 family metallopeptidase [Acidimicrobiales bacterium]